MKREKTRKEQKCEEITNAIIDELEKDVKVTLDMWAKVYDTVWRTVDLVYETRWDCVPTPEPDFRVWRDAGTSVVPEVWTTSDNSGSTT